MVSFCWSSLNSVKLNLKSSLDLPRAFVTGPSEMLIVTLSYFGAGGGEDEEDEVELDDDDEVAEVDFDELEDAGDDEDEVEAAVEELVTELDPSVKTGCVTATKSAKIRILAVFGGLGFPGSAWDNIGVSVVFRIVFEFLMGWIFYSFLQFFLIDDFFVFWLLP